jgi:anti-sigma-K factor RskA
MPEEHVYDLLPAYALGSLDDDELVQVARHLPRCTVCRGELSAYWATVDYLALAAPPRNPPAGLKSRILQRVATQGGRLPAAPARRRSFADVFRSWKVRPVAFGLGALALVLVVVLAVSNLMLWQQINTLQERVPAGNFRIVHLSGSQNAPQAQGYLMIFPKEDYGTLVVEDVPPLDPGYQYQLWLINDQGERSNGGVFSVDEHGYGVLNISADMPLEYFPTFGVTIEPEGGSPGPTGDRVLGGSL